MRSLMMSWKMKVAIASVASLGVAVLVAAVATGQVPPPVPPRNEHRDTRFTENGLLTSNRTALSICVQGVGVPAAEPEAARQRIEQALPEVALHPGWARAGLATIARNVRTGCPKEPLLMQPGVEYVDGVPGAYGGEDRARTTDASPYRLFVFVLPAQDTARIIRGRSSVRVAPQEFLCQDSNCVQVTTGLYLTPEEVNNPVLLRTWLVKALGLESLAPLESPPGAPTPPARSP